MYYYLRFHFVWLICVIIYSLRLRKVRMILCICMNSYMKSYKYIMMLYIYILSNVHVSDILKYLNPYTWFVYILLVVFLVFHIYNATCKWNRNSISTCLFLVGLYVEGMFACGFSLGTPPGLDQLSCVLETNAILVTPDVLCDGLDQRHLRSLGVL